MKKSIFIALLLCSCQLHGYQGSDSATFIFADALIWKLREASSESWAQEISPSGASQAINVRGVTFDWKTGFRVGAVRQLQHDHWDTVLAYTYYKSIANSQAYANPGAVSSPFAANFYVNNTNGASITLDPTYRSAGIQWKVYFNVIDFELGRKFHVDNFLQLRPFIGLKGAVINQRINTSWNNPTNVNNFSFATENLKNDFSGVGPAVGLDTKWLIYKKEQTDFNVIANLSGALMWGNWHFKDKYVNNGTTKVSINVSAINGAAATARGLLGLEWNHFMSKANISVRVGYETQVWFDQSQFYSYSMGRENTLLSLQGAVIGLGIYF